MPKYNPYDVLNQNLQRLTGTIAREVELERQMEYREDIQNLRQEETDLNAREVIANASIHNRNLASYLEISSKLNDDVVAQYAATDWENIDKVRNVSDNIFGEEGLISSAQSEFERRYIPIENTSNDFLAQARREFSKTRSAKADRFLELNEKGAREAFENRTREQTQRILTEAGALGAALETGKLSGKDVPDTFLGALANIDNLFGVANATQMLSDVINPETGERYEVFVGSPFNDETILNTKQVTAISAFNGLVATGHTEEAYGLLIELRERGKSNPELQDFLASSYEGEKGSPFQLERTLEKILQTAVLEDVSEISENLEALKTANNEARSLINNFSIYGNSDEHRVAISDLEKRISQNAETFVSKTRSDLDLAVGLGLITADQRDREMMNAEFDLKFNYPQSAGGSGQSVSTSINPNESIQDHMANFASVNPESTITEQFISALDIKTSNPEAGGLNESDANQIATIMERVYRDSPELADAMFFNLKNRKDNPWFFGALSKDENNRLNRLLTTSRSAEMFLQRFRNPDPVEDIELSITPVDPNITSAVESFRMSSKRPNKSFVPGQASNAMVELQKFYMDTEGSDENQAFQMATDRSTNSSVLGHIAGVKINPEVADMYIAGILIRSGVIEVNADTTSYDISEALKNYEVTPISRNFNDPENLRFVARNARTGRAATLEGKEIIFDFSELINNREIETPEDLRDYLATNTLFDDQVDMSIRLLPYDGGMTNWAGDLFLRSLKAIGNFAEGSLDHFMQRQMTNLSIDNRTVRFMEDDVVLTEENKAWAEGTSFDGAITPSLFATQNINLVFDPTEAYLSQVEKVLGPQRADQMRKLSQEARLWQDRGYPQAAGDRIIMSAAAIASELAIKKSLENNGEVIDLDEFENSGEFVAAIRQERPDLYQTALATMGAEEFNALPFVEQITHFAQWADQAFYNSRLDSLQYLTSVHGTKPEKLDNTYTFDQRLRRDAIRARHDLTDLIFNAIRPVLTPEMRELTSDQTSAMGRARLKGTKVQAVNAVNVNTLMQSQETLGYDKEIMIAGPWSGGDLSTNLEFWDYIFTNHKSGKPLYVDYQANKQFATAKIKGVYDGDTIVISRDVGVRVSEISEEEIEEQQIKVRLPFGNAPEVENFFKQTFGEQGGLAARKFVIEALDGSYFLFDPLLDQAGNPMTGQYGRPLSNIQFTKNRDLTNFSDLTEELVRAGLETVRPTEDALSPDQYSKYKALLDAQDQAKQLSVGLHRPGMQRVYATNENYFYTNNDAQRWIGTTEIVDGKPVKRTLVTYKPFDYAEETFLIPNFNVETGEIYSEDQIVNGFMSIYNDVVNKKVFPYPSEARAKSHMQDFIPRVSRGDFRERLISQELFNYMSNSLGNTMQGHVDRVKALTSDWPEDRLRVVMTEWRKYNPYRIPDDYGLTLIYDELYK